MVLWRDDTAAFLPVFSVIPAVQLAQLQKLPSKGSSDPNLTVCDPWRQHPLLPSPKWKSLDTQSLWKRVFTLFPTPAGKQATKLSSCYTAVGMDLAQAHTTSEAGQVPNSPSSTCCCLCVTLVPQDHCTGGMKEKTFHALVCCQPPAQ